MVMALYIARRRRKKSVEVNNAAAGAMSPGMSRESWRLLKACESREQRQHQKKVINININAGGGIKIMKMKSVCRHQKQRQHRCENSTRQ